MSSNTFNLNKALTSLLFISGLLLVAPVSAQNYGNNNGSNIHVTVYEHCDFGGAARNVPVGDFPDMRSIQLKNDSISSVRVPEGLQLTLYQDDRYGGFSTTVERDVSCLEKAWNDQASSLKVNWSNASDNRDGVEDRNYRGGNDNGYYTQQNVNGNNVSRVEFADSVLEKSGQQQWQLTSRNGSSTSFREASKNANAIYLAGVGNREQLQVDLFSNDVTIVTSNGQRSSYALRKALRANENYRDGGRDNPNFADRPRNGPVLRTQPVEETRNKGQVRGSCFDFKAYSNGAEAGVRFNSGDKTFNRFTNKPVSGRICDQGSIAMELSKREPSTDITVEIQGVKYRFASTEAHDALLNGWYRKNVTLSVRR